MSLTIRVRTQLGTWRLLNVNPSDTLGDLRLRLETEHRTDLEGRSFTLEPGGGRPLADDMTINIANLSNGEMIYAMIDVAQTLLNDVSHPMLKTIAKDGTIVVTEGSDDSKGFRRGMPALRDMKMQWTLNQFISMDEQVTSTTVQPIFSSSFMEQLFNCGTWNLLANFSDLTTFA